MADDHSDLTRWKPGVPKTVLLFVSGAMWLGVGIMLDSMAASWLNLAPETAALISAGVGLLAGVLVHRLGFVHIVDKNLKRILPMEGKRCLFAFMPIKSYFLVALMVGMGITLRHSPLPKVYLAAIYLCMGTAMVLSSLRYLRYFVLLLRGETPEGT